MEGKAFQKIYTKINKITKATCTLTAEGIGNDEMAYVDGKPAQVVKLEGNEVTLQVFQGTEGIATNAEVVFTGKPPVLKVSEELAGRFFNAYGDPIDGGPAIEGEEREIGGPSVNPVRRKQPSELIKTGIAGIDKTFVGFYQIQRRLTEVYPGNKNISFFQMVFYQIAHFQIMSFHQCRRFVEIAFQTE